MTVNQPLFQQVHDIISVNPERHDQRDWKARTECGTTFCAGGWAIVLTTGSEEELWEQARRAGYNHVSDYARNLLGLTAAEAYALFYATEDDEAAQVIAQFAEFGESPELARLIEANEIREEDF